MAALHSGCDLSERERLILEARTNDVWDLRDIALDLGISWKQALKIEAPLLAEAGAHPDGLPKRRPASVKVPWRKIEAHPERLSKSESLAQRAWRQAAEMGKSRLRFRLQVEGNVIRIERVTAHRAARTVKP